jgi:putative DNA primase/helicase
MSGPDHDMLKAERRAMEMGGAVQQHLDDIRAERNDSDEPPRTINEPNTDHAASGLGENGHDPDAGRSTKETQAAMLEAALYYASKGLEVFPAPPGTKKSHKKAQFSNDQPWGKTIDGAEIKRDWKHWPEANVCIATGPGSGCFVVEVDTPAGHNVDGFASLRALETIHRPLPETRQAISPSGSIHYYFNWPKTGTIINSTSKIGPGIDVRGDGGMVIAPPSLKPGVGAYSWLSSHSVVDAPDWLLALLVETIDKTERKSGANPQADPAKVAAAMAVIPNDDLNWEEWNSGGMAVWNATGGVEAGFAAFDLWSKKSSKYSDTAESNPRERWNNYFNSPPKKIGAGTIFKLANEASPGWLAKYEAQKNATKGFSLVCAKDIIMRPKQWLWKGHLLRGAQELLSGVPGLGKSQVQISFVACVTAGLPWPDGTAGMAPANVIMLTAEDVLDQEVVPRLIAAGADLARVQILKCIRSDGKDRQFLLGEDLDVLEKAVVQTGDVALVTIDPITAYMGGKIDSHKTTEVRSQLGPLKDFSERVNVANSTITHPPKSSSQKAIDHFIGSQAFIAAGRIGHLCIAETEVTQEDDKKETGRILFTHAKHNPSVRMPTLAYRVAEIVVGRDDDTHTNIAAPHVVWEKDPVNITANEAVQAASAAAAGGGKNSEDQKEARAFILEVLGSYEPVPAKDILAQGKERGFSTDQLKRAKRKVGGIVSEQGKDGWSWKMTL